MPGLGTIDLQLHFKRRTAQPDGGLARKIMSAMLLSALTFDFPSHAKLAAAMRLRCNIVVAARKSALAFRTTAAELASQRALIFRAMTSDSSRNSVSKIRLSPLPARVPSAGGWPGGYYPGSTPHASGL